MKIYFFDMNGLTEDDLRIGYDMLEPTKKARVDRCQNENQKKNIIASDLLTRRMLSKALGINPEEFVFAHSSHGKPILIDGKVNFNVSHSGNCWVGCVSENPCGIDIELIREIKLNATRRYCNNEEMEYINAHSNPQLAALEIWTRKEAYFKSIGCGIATVLTAVNVLTEENLATNIYNDYIISVYGAEQNFKIESL